MRTITAGSQLDKLLSSGVKARSDHLRVDVDIDGAGTFQDLTNYEGRDWVRSAKWGESIDSPVATANVVLWREREKLSLVNLMSTSKANQPSTFLQVGRDIRIYTATLSADQLPATADWILAFEGQISKNEWGGDRSRIVLQARDPGGLLMDTWFEEEYQAGSAAPGTLLHTEIQNILDDAVTNGWLASADKPTLYWPDPPGPPTKRIILSEATLIRKQRLFPVLRDVAMSIGWDLRFKWDNGTSAFRLTLYEPDRSSPSSDRTFDSTQYKTLPSVNEDLADIRNAVDIVYYDTVSSIRTRTTETGTAQAGAASTITLQSDASATDDFYNGRIITITAGTGSGQSRDIDDYTGATKIANISPNWSTNPDATSVYRVEIGDRASITKYGRRWSPIAEAATSVIDSNDEAQALGDAFISDLAEPSISHRSRSPYFFAAQLNDHYTFSANDTHYDTDQSLALVRAQHEFKASGRAGTEMSLRGLPSSGVRHHIERIADRGVAPSADFTAPALLAAPTLTEITSASEHGIEVAASLPPESDWDWLEYHISTTSFGTSAPDDTSLSVRSRSTSATIWKDTTSGQTNYVAVVPVDRKGNKTRSTSVNQASIIMSA